MAIEANLTQLQYYFGVAGLSAHDEMRNEIRPGESERRVPLLTTLAEHAIPHCSQHH